MFNGLDYDGLARFKGWISGFLALKVDKETGKGLSTNDYTTNEKNKLSGIESGAQVNTVTSVNGQTGAVTISAGEARNNKDTTVGSNTVVETDLVTGNVITTTFNSNGSITEVCTNNGTTIYTKTITFSGNNIQERYT